MHHNVRNLFSLLALAWLDWKQQHFSALEVAEDIVRIVREQELFSHAERLQQWAERMDEMYLEELDADKPYDIVQPLFYRARFAALFIVCSTTLLWRIKAWIICSTSTPSHRRPIRIT